MSMIMMRMTKRDERDRQGGTASILKSHSGRDESSGTGD